MQTYFFQYSYLILTVLVLAGCGVTTEVTIFSEIDIKNKYKKYDFLKLKEQENNIEYNNYARKINSHLLKGGFVQVNEKEAPEYIVVFNYGCDSGTTYTYSYPIYGVTSPAKREYFNIYSSGSYSCGEIYSPAKFGIIGQGTGYETIYKRAFNLYIYQILDAKKDQAKIVFKGEAKSSGHSSSFHAVYDNMINAALLQKLWIEEGMGNRKRFQIRNKFAINI